MDQIISTPIHLNNHIMCAVGCLNTGPNPTYHELSEIALIPLKADYTQDKRFGLCNLVLKPEMKEFEIPEDKFRDYCRTGFTRERALELFDSWFGKFNMKTNKKIVPVCYDWPKWSKYILRWMGWLDFKAYFHELEYRDPLCAALYANDSADVNIEQVHYAKLGFNALANRTVNELVNKYDCMGIAMNTMKIWKDMLKQLF